MWLRRGKWAAGQERKSLRLHRGHRLWRRDRRLPRKGAVGQGHSRSGRRPLVLAIVVMALGVVVVVAVVEGALVGTTRSLIRLPEDVLLVALGVVVALAAAPVPELEGAVVGTTRFLIRPREDVLLMASGVVVVVAALEGALVGTTRCLIRPREDVLLVALGVVMALAAAPVPELEGVLVRHTRCLIRPPEDVLDNRAARSTPRESQCFSACPFLSLFLQFHFHFRPIFI